MKNTLKLTAVSLAIASALSAWAATTITPDGTGKMPITPTNCPAVQEGFSVKQSANVAAGFACGVTHVGIGTANAKGQGVTFRIQSGGGEPKKTTGQGSNGAAKKFADATEAQNKANEDADTALTEAGSTT